MEKKKTAREGKILVKIFLAVNFMWMVFGIGCILLNPGIIVISGPVELVKFLIIFFVILVLPFLIALFAYKK